MTKKIVDKSEVKASPLFDADVGRKSDSVAVRQRLHNASEHDIFGIEELRTALQEAEMKKKEVLNKYRITETARGRYYTRINGIRVERVSREKLEKEILEFEAGLQKENAATIAAIWDDFLIWRRTTAAAETVTKDERYYRDYFSNSPLVRKTVKTLTRQDALTFFRSCREIKPNMTKRYWAQIRATGGTIFNYLMELGLAGGNIFEGLKIHRDNFAEEKYTLEEDTVFSDYESNLVKKEALEEIKTGDAAAYGILLTFALGLRVGELCALQWRDLEIRQGKEVLHVQRQLVRNGNEGYKIVPHAKTVAGNRYLALNEYTCSIFKRIRAMNALKGICVTETDELVFQRNWRGKWTYCTVRVFDNKLINYCRRAGMSVKKSMHDIRRTCLTKMYDNGIKLKQLQYFAGHSTPQQTLDYIRRQEGVDIDPWLIDDSDLLEEASGTTVFEKSAKSAGLKEIKKVPQVLTG